jgi:hypothetical protein
MSLSEQLARLPARPEPRPEPTGPAVIPTGVAGSPGEAGREPTREWEGYDLAVLEAILDG